MSDWYVLDADHNVVPSTMKKASRFFEDVDRRRVAEDVAGGGRVSTVFLCLDHSFIGRNGPPLVFETMVFGGLLDGHMDRYCTWAAAVDGHAAMLHKVRLHQAAGFPEVAP